MNQLPAPLLEQLNAQFRDARAKVESGDREGGIKTAEGAWERLPEPKFDWDATKIYVHSLAKLYRDCGKYDQALALMNDLFASGTVQSYDAEPYFIEGTVYYEMGDLKNAQKWLNEANKISKGRCFQGKPPKYKQAIAKAAEPA